MSKMPPTYDFGRRLLHSWAVLTALSAFVLLLSGGIVTSKGVGMAVPDWPTTFGYNMFLFPVSKWIGGIFYEHSHRLIASGVGLMTVGLAIGAFVLEPRRGVRIFALWLLAAVIVQGLFGGLRVVLNRDHVGIIHATLAQSFFSALLVFCVVTSKSFVMGRWADYDPSRTPRRLAYLVTGLVFLQLGLGAAMRHEHIGLAVPDFPLAYGKILPDTSPSAMEQINAKRAVEGNVPLKASYVWVHVAHRFLAVGICVAICFFAFHARKCSNAIRRLALLLLVMILAQFTLGAWTVLSGKSELIATAHMALGALVLATAVLTSFRLALGARAADFVVPESLTRHSSAAAA